MTQQVAQGGVVTLSAIYKDGGGNLVDPIDPFVDILDPDENVILTNAAPVHDSLGHYHYDYTVPDDGPLGRWAAHFDGTIDGYLAGADDEFDVIAPGAIITSAYDLLTLEEAKAALNIDPDDEEFDDELAMYVTAVSQRLDDLCGPIVKRSITESHYPGAGALWLNKPPVATVGSVVEHRSGAATVLTAETLETEGGYVLLDAGTMSSRLVRRSSWYDTSWTDGATVVVSYVAGRFDSTAAVSAKFKQAAAKTLAWLWRGDQGVGSATFGGAEGASLFGLGFALPNVVKELLAEETFGPVIS